MSAAPSFDFAGLAARATADSPDAHLFALLGKACFLHGEMEVARRRGERAYRKALGMHCREAVALSDQIAMTPARSREGMIAKARYALEQNRTPGTVENTFAGIHGAAFSALHDFLAAEGWA